MPTYRYPVKITWAGTGSPGVNVWHLRTVSDGPLNNDLEQIVDAIKDFYTAIASIYMPSTTIAGPGEAIKDPEGSPEYEQVTPWSVAGLSSGSGYLPMASQLCVSWRTTSATRSGRGRTFLGPLSLSGVQADGTPTAGLISTVQTAATNLVNFSNGFDNGAVGVYSQTQNVLRDIVSSNVRDTFAVLRSRRD